MGDERQKAAIEAHSQSGHGSAGSPQQGLSELPAVGGGTVSARARGDRVRNNVDNPCAPGSQNVWRGEITWQHGQPRAAIKEVR